MIVATSNGPPASAACPACGGFRFLSEWSNHLPEWTARGRRCAQCGHRVITAEWIDSAPPGGLSCPNCHSRRLVCTNTYRRLTEVARLRRCKKCGTQVRTVERLIPVTPRQPRKPGPLVRPFRHPKHSTQREN